jgi:DNA-binding PadR family transcriptional regulator
MKVEAHLPLKAPIFLILLALAERDAHGYALVQEVRSRSEGRVDLETGPLYRHLRRLSDDGLVEDVEAPAEDVGLDQRRKYYRLTSFGRRVLAAETRRLAELVEVGRRLDLLEDPAGA